MSFASDAAAWLVTGALLFWSQYKINQHNFSVWQLVLAAVLVTCIYVPLENAFWLIPMILTKPVHQLQNTIEHLGLSHEDDILENTRSTRTNAFFRWLCWQMPYHTAHHTFPAVPFWKLRDLNAKIEASAGTATFFMPATCFMAPMKQAE